MSGLGQRTQALERLAASEKDPFDLLVVGGGITGAGIALDAASRGLSVGLVERSDFASGTSSKSSKLVHGGLRYLEQREFGLMREAAQERDLLRRLAPQLVEPIPFVLPVADRWMRAKFGAGLWAYDALASFKNLAVHRYLGVDETEKAVPPLPEGKVKGGFLFYDCKSDDVRLVMEVLMQAVRYGASVVNYVQVLAMEGSADGCLAEVEDRVAGERFQIRARKIVVAAGVWGDKVDNLARVTNEARLRPSKGVHLVFDRQHLPMADAAAFIPDAERERMLFVIPWLDSVIVGTTDTPFEGDIDRPTVEDEDRRYVLDAVNSVFQLELTDGDIAGAWAGLRPLIAGKAGSTADLSRKHTIYRVAPSIIGITGGKLTTYRRMAKEAVDEVAEELGAPGRCKTHWIRLGCNDVSAVLSAVGRRGRRLGLEAAQVQNLVRCYGDRSLEVIDVAEKEGLAEPLTEGHQPLAAEAVYCAGSEMVVHLNDLLARRTRLALVDPAAGSSGHGPELLAGALGWSGDHLAGEVAAHREAIERERGIPLHAGTPRSTPESGAGAS
jgi:glycerol-3-phosphate dehydrogenase